MIGEDDVSLSLKIAANSLIMDFLKPAVVKERKLKINFCRPI
jgi:hypothetical protein